MRVLIQRPRPDQSFILARAAPYDARQAGKYHRMRWRETKSPDSDLNRTWREETGEKYLTRTRMRM